MHNPMARLALAVAFVTRLTSAVPTSAPSTSKQVSHVTRDDILHDGMYTYSRETRSLTHTKLEHSNMTAPFDLNATTLERRGVSWPSGSAAYCDEPEEYLWSDNLYQQAWNGLWNYGYTGGKVHSVDVGKYDWVAFKYGQALAYMCNYGVGKTHSGIKIPGNPVNPAEWSDAVNQISGKCTKGTNGWKQSGYFAANTPGSTGGWNKAYGYTHPNQLESICGYLLYADQDYTIEYNMGG